MRVRIHSAFYNRALHVTDEDSHGGLTKSLRKITLGFWTPGPLQFCFFRIVLGLSTASLFLTQSATSTLGTLPQMYWRSGFVILCVLFTLGIARRYLSVPLAIGIAYWTLGSEWTAGWIAQPLSYLLLVTTFIGEGEPRVGRVGFEPDFRVPVAFYWSTWVMVGCSYAASGLFLLNDSHWSDGRAIYAMLEGGAEGGLSLSNVWFEALRNLSAPIAWAITLTELAFLPLVLFPSTRRIAWTATLLLHAGLAVIGGLPSQALGVLNMHLFLFQPSWIPPRAIAHGKQGPIVLFDGVCGLCNRFVDFVIQHSADDRVRFAALQSPFAARLLGPAFDLTVLDTILVSDEDRVLSKSSAVLHIMRYMGGVWRFVALLRFIPRFLRDIVYDFVAKRRYGWFGKTETCRLPTREERDRLLYD